LGHKKINLSTVFAGQAVGIKEVEEGICLVSFRNYDLGYVDLEKKTLQPLGQFFWPKVLPMCPGRTFKIWSGRWESKSSPLGFSRTYEVGLALIWKDLGSLRNPYCRRNAALLP